MSRLKTHDRRRGRTGFAHGQPAHRQRVTDGGFDVKVSEVHGMSQRAVRWSPMSAMGQGVFADHDQGEADVIVSFEECEAARCCPV